jgi:seryl-tRNA synthetase
VHDVTLLYNVYAQVVEGSQSITAIDATIESSGFRLLYNITVPDLIAAQMRLDAAQHEHEQLHTENQQLHTEVSKANTQAVAAVAAVPAMALQQEQLEQYNTQLQQQRDDTHKQLNINAIHVANLQADMQQLQVIAIAMLLNGAVHIEQLQQTFIELDCFYHYND